MTNVIDRAIQRIEQSETITEENKIHLKNFTKHLKSLGITEKRISKYLSILPKIAEWLGMDFLKAEKQDIHNLVTKIIE